KLNLYHKKLLVDKKINTSLPKELISEVIAKQLVSAVNIPVMN
ncbi:6899_t:CDS:1, partial [Funneliformis geosporum]